MNDDRLKQYWQAYLATRSEGTVDETYEADTFGDYPDLANRLARLVLLGVKIATCSALWEWEAEGSPLPSVGLKTIVLNGDRQPVCIIETTEVTICPFNEVDAEFAYEEGEDDRSLESWQTEHWKYFARVLPQIGKEPTPEMPLVCERFQVVHPNLKAVNRQKTLYILIGPKGAGKTHIGTQIARHTTIQFIRVEPIWLKLAPGENGWEAVEKAIDRAFQQHDEVAIESLGAGDGFDRFHASLMTKYNVKRIKVYTDLAECLKRVKNRDNSEHIPVSDEKVEEYNKIATSVHHVWDAIVDNNALVTNEEILKVIESLRLS
ncbi:MAG: ASCH domain-containing protein [Cyanosarcina radialis HA8281-LM2]|jgi:uncharacterized protein YhfF/shikimate kinase|nr:ASCH domain-containing protein [Cyanosarcina radialis HA8281-LM2]